MVNHTKKFHRALRIILFLSLIVYVLTCCHAEAARKRRKTKSQAVQDPSEQSVLPKKGDIAVLVEGPEEHVKRAEANIINMLVNRGYRVVDEAKMKRIRMAAARALADKYILYGEKHKILSINASYNVAATVIANIIPEEARENRIKLFTGTASAAVIAVKSNGVRLGGKTYTSKKVGYTQAEALRKAVDDAIQNSMMQIF